MSEQAVARLGDSFTATCLGHAPSLFVSGTLDQCSSVATADGIGIVLVGHGGLATCGHRCTVTGGSSVLDVGGVKVARVGDPVVMAPGGSGAVSSGSPNVKSA